MITTLIAGVLATSIMTTSLPASPNTIPDYSFSQVISNDDYSIYVVQEGDFLSKIAQSYYGSEDYWTNIWNDNANITDASHLEVGTALKIRNSKTILPEVLISELDNTDSVSEPVYSYTQPIQSTPLAGSSATVTPEQPQAAQPVNTNAPQVLSEEQITYLGTCEAGMDPAKNTGNGYYGAFQFSAATWNSMGTGYARADLAPLEVQKAAVQRLVARSSIFTQFPGCSKKMRSLGII